MMASFHLTSCIRGYHIYKEIWTPKIGKEDKCQCEPGNREDPYAVAIKKDDSVVGHIFPVFVLYLYNVIAVL